MAKSPPKPRTPSSAIGYTSIKGSIGVLDTTSLHLSYSEYIIKVEKSLLPSAGTATWKIATLPWGTEKRCIYYFEIVSGSLSSIITQYTKAKSSIKRGFSYYGGATHSTKTLYVGKYVTGCIRQRIKEHFGYGHPKTGALQLDYWLDTEVLNLHILAFSNKTNPAVINAIEKLFIANLNPLIGKD